MKEEELLQLIEEHVWEQGGEEEGAHALLMEQVAVVEPCVQQELGEMLIGWGFEWERVQQQQEQEEEEGLQFQCHLTIGVFD